MSVAQYLRQLSNGEVFENAINDMNLWATLSQELGMKY